MNTSLAGGVLMGMLLSAVVLLPCMLVMALHPRHPDLHHRFHLWWEEKFLSR